MRKKTINKNQRLQIIGLMTLGHQAAVKLREIDKAFISIVGKEEGKYDSQYSLLSDEYFEDSPDVDSCLIKMGIKVK